MIDATLPFWRARPLGASAQVPRGGISTRVLAEIMSEPAALPCLPPILYKLSLVSKRCANSLSSENSSQDYLGHPLTLTHAQQSRAQLVPGRVVNRSLLCKPSF